MPYIKAYLAGTIIFEQFIGKYKLACSTPA